MRFLCGGPIIKNIVISVKRVIFNFRFIAGGEMGFLEGCNVRRVLVYIIPKLMNLVSWNCNGLKTKREEPGGQTSRSEMGYLRKHLEHSKNFIPSLIFQIVGPL